MLPQRPVRFLSTLVFLLTAFCIMPTVLGQSSTATLSGSVEDQNSAAIPGVTIAIVNKGTMATRETSTNDAGYFIVPLLPPGNYIVRARRDGFAPIDFSEIVLNVGDNKALRIQLKAGDLNAQVTIDSDAETVRTDGSVGTVVDRQFVANMPLNGRSLQALIQLTPGVVLTTASGGATGGQQFSVNGQRTTTNYYMVDGVSANTGIQTGMGEDAGAAATGQTPGTTALGGTNSLVSLDALQEFRIETSTFAPEFGRTPGGQISLLTRGGTNEFHGSASEYFRNDVLDANDWFANANRLRKPKERQNLFGGVFGGPIKKERLFFFVSYEGLRLRQPKVQTVTVPTAAVRAQAVPFFRPFLNALPLPNGQDFGNGTARFAASYSNTGTFNIFSLRLDGRVANNLTAFFRYNHAPSEATSRALSLSTVVHTQVSDDSYTGGMTWVASPRLTADVRLNWTRNAPKSFGDLDTLGGAVVPSASDIFLAGRNPSNSIAFFFAPLNAGVFQWGAGNADVQRQFNAVGTLGWSVGSHQLKLGVDYRRLLPLLGGSGLNQESINPTSIQSLITGRVDTLFEQANDPVAREPIVTNLSLFAQDTWHVSSRLTLTYGLRFERIPPPGEARGRLPLTFLGIDHGVLNNPRLAPAGTPLFRGHFGEFAPRSGVAYQLNRRSGWEMTLRGGVGIFYDLGLGDIAGAFEFAHPFVAQTRLTGLSLPLNPSDRVAPTVPATTITSNYPMFVLDPALRMPYTVQWNGAVEQSLGSADAVTVTYVGAAGRRLLALDEIDTPLADFPGIPVLFALQRNVGESSYKALQVQYRRRLQHGLQALASYTFGSSRDNASDDTQDTLNPPSTQTSLLARQYGPSNFDVRHVLSSAITYDLPKLSGPSLLSGLLNGWGLDVLIRYQSAFPVTPTAGAVSFPDGEFFRRRPNLIPGVPLYLNNPAVPSGRTFNNAIPTADQIAAAGCVPLNASRTNAKGALCTPPAGQQGNFPRNGLRGFAASQVDLALRREFRLSEKIQLQLRSELFNLFNHPNFGPPQASITSGLFGQPTSMLNNSLGGLNGLYQMGGPRSAQLAVKFIW